jgi:hypothetical protein
MGAGYADRCDAFRGRANPGWFGCGALAVSGEVDDGEELNSSEVTDRGLVGDRQFAVVDRATGKVGGPRIRGSGATSLTFGRPMPRLRDSEDGFPRFGSRSLTGRW